MAGMGLPITIATTLTAFGLKGIIAGGIIGRSGSLDTGFIGTSAVSN